MFGIVVDIDPVWVKAIDQSSWSRREKIHRRKNVFHSACMLPDETKADLN